MNPDETLAELRSQGVRVTAARRAVVEALALLTDHPTADDVHAFLESGHPAINRSTVYRTLEALEAIGVVDHVHFGQRAATYHLSTALHWHAACDQCGRVFDVPASIARRFASDLRASSGFELSPHYALSGLCELCQPG